MYSISTRGWNRISYLQRQLGSAQKPSAERGDPLREGWAAHYLLKGQGKVKDALADMSLKMVAKTLSHFPSTLDEVGMLLSNLDQGLISHEAMLSVLMKTCRDKLFQIKLKRTAFVRWLNIILGIRLEDNWAQKCVVRS